MVLAGEKVSVRGVEIEGAPFPEVAGVDYSWWTVEPVGAKIVAPPGRHCRLISDSPALVEAEAPSLSGRHRVLFC